MPPRGAAGDPLLLGALQSPPPAREHAHATDPALQPLTRHLEDVADLLGVTLQAPQQSRRRPMQSGELKLDLADAAAHRADDDLDVVAQLGHQFQQLGFADATELTAGDA